MNTNDAIIKHINEEDKLTYNNIQSLSTATPLGIEVESENTIYINETGLYTLMLSSQQKQAIKLKNYTELFKSEFYDIVVSKIKELISKTTKY